MDALTKSLKTNNKQNETISTIDYGNTWSFNATESDDKRQEKKIWHKQRVLMMASRVNRSNINEMLMKE